MINVKNGPIDLVIPWVNGEDPQWQQKAAPYLSVKDFNGERFRDWGILKYLFRSIDQYLPWINQIYLITDDQVPVWLVQIPHLSENHAFSLRKLPILRVTLPAAQWKRTISRR